MTAPDRITAGYADWLADRCSTRDLAILQTVNRLRLVSGSQLERLHFAGLAGRSRAVSRWRVLKRLTDWRLIAPLDRRVGGCARGSAGMVLSLDSAGVRLLRLNIGLRVRRPTTPGGRKIKHSIAVAELYTGLVEHSRAQGFTVAHFEIEPRYQTGAGWISPDAYAVLATGDVADHWWIEVDLATESAVTVGQKIEAYAAYYQQGRWASLGVMPRVLVIVPDEHRREQLKARLARLADTKTIAKIVLLPTATHYVSRRITTTHY